MTPTEIYPIVLAYIDGKLTVICRLHSACSPNKDRSYRCIIVGSKYDVIDFDAVKIKMDIERRLESRKSVDALALPPNQSALCFVELKSWDLLLSNGGTESKVRRQASKYASDLPQKLTDSLSICRDIIGDENTLMVVE
ncbi:MAG: hypothetical protein HDR88_01690 [Bacteroides sp.]|nr:hypothetical protein [Bacteroides sp.]